MPDASLRLRLARLLRRRFLIPVGALSAAALAGLAAASMLAPSRGHAQPAPAATAVATATPTPVATDASVLTGITLIPSFSTDEGADFAAIVTFAQAAAQPTATPVPPTATPVPPTPRPTVARARPTAPPAAPAAPRQAPAPAGLDTSPMTALEQALFDATNRRRASQGLPPLVANSSLVGIARIRSHDMADHNYFSHTSPVTGDTAFSLMDRYGIPYGWAGENLAENNYPLDQCEQVADDALWNSPPHRENILGTHYTQAGVGFAASPSGMVYFTVIFVGPP